MFQITHLWGIEPNRFVPLTDWHIRQKDIINVVKIMTRETHSDCLPEGLEKAYQVRFKTYQESIDHHPWTLPMAYGLIDQNQMERFERFIGGMEDPGWDIVEVFRSHPTFGTETASARKRFHDSLNSFEQSGENKKLKE